MLNSIRFMLLVKIKKRKFYRVLIIFFAKKKPRQILPKRLATTSNLTPPYFINLLFRKGKHHVNLNVRKLESCVFMVILKSYYNFLSV